MRTPFAGKFKSGRTSRVICRQLPRLLLLSSLLALSLSASPIVQYQVATVGATGTYQYFVSGFDFRANQPCQNNPMLQCSDELDIQFAPNVFGQLSNGLASSGFDVELFQPNNPPQASGDYSALAIVDHPSLNGIFSVAFTLTGMGTPGSQAFTINQFDSNGTFQGVVASGSTLTESSAATPEPASFALFGAGLIIGGVFLAFRAHA